MSRITTLLALCLVLVVTFTNAGTIGARSSSPRDNELGPQAMPQEENVPTPRSLVTRDDAPSEHVHSGDDNATATSKKESTAQDHSEYPPSYGGDDDDITPVSEGEPAPSPEIVRLGPSPDNLDSLLGNGNGQFAGYVPGVGNDGDDDDNNNNSNNRNEDNDIYNDDSGAGMLRMSWTGLGVTAICIAGWLL